MDIFDFIECDVEYNEKDYDISEKGTVNPLDLFLNFINR